MGNGIATDRLCVSMRLRVEWGHCDPARIIFNPNYYIWMDYATHALLKVAGFDLAEQLKDPTVRGFPLVKSEAEFISPAYYGDVLTLHSHVAKTGNKSFVTSHQFVRGEQTLCSGSEVRVWGTADIETPDVLKAVAVPEWIKRALLEERHVDVTV